MDDRDKRVGDALVSAHSTLIELRGPVGSPGWGSFFWAPGGGGYQSLRDIENALDELMDPRGEQLRESWQPSPKR